MQDFKALILTQKDGKTHAEVKNQTYDNLPEGDVRVKIKYSGINYKDALAVTGTGKIIRDFPFIPGIDFVGEVDEIQGGDFNKGDKVILTGWGVGERHYGGYAEMANVKSKWLIPLPKNLSLEQSMIIGTAGFTAGLSVKAIVDAGIKPESGEVVVSGASGGVGSFAIALLANLGYSVTAVSRPNSNDYLAQLGAKNFLTREEMAEDSRPLEKSKWSAAVDTVGNQILARIIAEMQYHGTVTACGLAGGFKLPTTVMPFILRGVTLKGIDSVMCPIEKRQETWNFIADNMKTEQYQLIHNKEIILSDLPQVCQDILSGEIQGRVTVKV